MLGFMQDLPDDGLDQTTDALESGVTSLTPTAAVTIIDRWRSACQQNNDIDLGDVEAGLDTLKGLLTADRLDGRAIGATLAGLAEATAAVMAQTNEERITPGLDRLAASLGRAATLLGAYPPPGQIGKTTPPRPRLALSRGRVSFTGPRRRGPSGPRVPPAGARRRRPTPDARPPTRPCARRPPARRRRCGRPRGRARR